MVRKVYNIGNRVKLSHGGTSYKKALPPEKWTDIESFLANFRIFAEIAEETGKSFEVSVFLDEYKKAFGKRKTRRRKLK